MFTESIKYAARGSISKANGWASVGGAIALWVGVRLMGYNMLAPQDWLQGIGTFVACLIAAWVLIFVGKLFFWPYREVRKTRKEIVALREQSAPRIRLLEILEYRQPRIHGSEDSFELHIQASDGAELNNCLVVVDKLDALDGTKPFTRHLPMALRTARNVERDGGGPFNLRPTQKKKVPLCTRVSGFPSPITLNYEQSDDHQAWAYSLRSTRDVVLEIDIHGPPAPPERVRLRCIVDDDGKLHVSRVNK